MCYIECILFQKWEKTREKIFKYWFPLERWSPQVYIIFLWSNTNTYYGGGGVPTYSLNLIGRGNNDMLCWCVRCCKRKGGTSHIAPPDMNSYLKKYKFISPVTYEFIHPALYMNSYVSDPCLVYKQNGRWRRGQGGGWSDCDDYEHDICLWFKSPPGCKLF